MKKQTKSPDFKYELELVGQYPLIAGIDEVGRGAIAGPIVAGAVVFNDFKKTKPKLKGVTDSKVLTAKQRDDYAVIIKKHAFKYAIGEVSADEIDQLGIGAANILAFKRAVDGLGLCDYCLIDGRKFRGFDHPFQCLEKGEVKSLSIAAASIIAKTYRDDLMKALSGECPEYMWEKNVGYGGRAHYAAIEKYGRCDIHRKSFLGKFYERSDQASLF